MEQLGSEPASEAESEAEQSEAETAAAKETEFPEREVYFASETELKETETLLTEGMEDISEAETEMIPADIGVFPKDEVVSDLELVWGTETETNCSLTNDIIEQMTGLSGVEYIDLSGNDISDITALAEYTTLKTVDVSNTYVDGKTKYPFSLICENRRVPVKKLALLQTELELTAGDTEWIRCQIFPFYAADDSGRYARAGRSGRLCASIRQLCADGSADRIQGGRQEPDMHDLWLRGKLSCAEAEASHKAECGKPAHAGEAIHQKAESDDG